MLIGVSIVATLVSFIENVIYISEDYSECFMMVSNQIGFNIGLFSFLRLVTDYSIMSTIIYQFWKSERHRYLSVDSGLDDEIPTFIDREVTYNSITEQDM